MGQKKVIPVDIEKRLVDDTVADQRRAYNENENQGLKRQLRNRHAQMIAIGGVIGTGLFLGTAGSLAHGGPGGLLLGYAVVSTVCVSVMLSLGELVTFLPVPGGQITLAGRFVDPALSFAIGWNYWYGGIISLPAELSAAAVLLSYWNDTINNAIWITTCLVVILIINFLGTRAFGECEFWFASIKVVTIVGLIIVGLVIDLGGAPDHDRRGFRYWHHPGAFTQLGGIPGTKGRFIMGITAAETRNPTKNIPRAITGVWVRILLFYIISVFIIGLICPSDNADLTTGTGTAASSAWVIAIQMAKINSLPSIINACILTSAWSAGSAVLYGTSQVLFGLASTGQAPKILTKTNRRGTPWLALIACSVFGLLAYMGISSGSSTVFVWFANMGTVSGMLNWMAICFTLIRFRRGLKAQGISTEILPYKSPFQPYAAYWGLFWTIVIALFADWEVFLRAGWYRSSFITTYFGIPFVLILYLGYKLIKKTTLVPLTEMDFVTFANRV